MILVFVLLGKSSGQAALPLKESSPAFSFSFFPFWLPSSSFLPSRTSTSPSPSQQPTARRQERTRQPTRTDSRHKTDGQPETRAAARRRLFCPAAASSRPTSLVCAGRQLEPGTRETCLEPARQAPPPCAPIRPSIMALDTELLCVSRSCVSPRAVWPLAGPC